MGKLSEKFTQTVGILAEELKEKYAYEVVSGRFFLLEGYSKIVIFGAEQMGFKVGKNTLIVNGIGLVLKEFSQAQVVVEGSIRSVEMV